MGGCGVVSCRTFYDTHEYLLEFSICKHFIFYILYYLSVVCETNDVRVKYILRLLLTRAHIDDVYFIKLKI